MFTVKANPLSYDNVKTYLDILGEIDDDKDKKLFVSLLKNGNKYLSQVDTFANDNQTLEGMLELG